MFRRLKLKAMIVIRIHMISELSDRPLGRIFLFLNFALMEKNDEKNCFDVGDCDMFCK